MHTCHGQLVARNLAVDLSQIPYPQLSYDDEDAADSVDEPEYLGNEHSPTCFRYHNTLVIIWAKAELASLLGLNAGDVLVDALISELARDISNRQDEEAVACATRFMKACCGSWKHRPSSTLPQMVEWGVALDDHALYEAAVKVGRDQGPVQRAVARLVEKEHAERADSGGFGAEDWDRWLGVVVKTPHTLAWLQSSLCGFASNLGDSHLKASFGSWRDATLTTQLEAKPRLEDGDAGFVLDAMFARREDTEWLTTSLLPKLCSRGTRSFLRRVLDGVFGRNDFALDEKKAIFRQIVESAKSAFSLPIAKLDRWSPEWDAFVSLIDRCLGLGLTDSVCHVLEESRRELQVAQLPDGAEHQAAGFLGNLVRMLRGQSSVEAPATAALKGFFETLIKVLLRTAPVYPEERFKGWTMPARGCGDSSCSECMELDRFLLAEDEKQIRMPEPDAKRWHMEGRLSRDGVIDWDTVREESSAARFLRVTKVKTVFQRDLDIFESKMRALEWLVEPLKGEYLEKLLGDHGYRELVLLEGIRPGAGRSEGKRPAEEEPGDAQKRRKTMAQ